MILKGKGLVSGLSSDELCNFDALENCIAVLVE